MKSERGEIRVLAKAASHISGFDQIMHGGLPEGRTTLIAGGPGTGKSVLALEFLYRGAVADQPGIYIAFEERASSVRRNALTLGWDLEPLEQAGKLAFIEPRLDSQAIISGDFNLKALLAIIEGQSRASGAKRVVFDALDVLMRLYDNPARERSEMYALYEWLLDRKMTTILTVKGLDHNSTFVGSEFLEFMADCVVRLLQRPGEWVSTRELQVIKYRGSDFGRNAYPFVIQPGGISVIPISEFDLQHKPLGPAVSSGNPGLDRVLGGGYRQGSSVLLAGASGTGKTTTASTFIRAACERGEKVACVAFEESEQALVAEMLSPGIDLRPALDAGRLKVISAMPEAYGTEKHLVRTFALIDQFRPDHVVVDAISAFERMGTRRAAFEFAMRLVNKCKDEGITTLLVNQSAGIAGEQIAISGVGISSTIDTILWLRFVDTGTQLKRVLLVVKSRGTKHSTQYHDFSITDRGLELPQVSGEWTRACKGEAEK